MDATPVNYFVSAGLWNAFFLVAGLAGAVLCKQAFSLKWFLIAIGLFNLNITLVLDFVQISDFLYRLAGVSNIEFNWAGKIIALSASLLLILSPLINRRAAGVTLHQEKKAYIGWGVFAILCAINLYIALQLDNPPHNLEAIAYQLTLPSFEEEIFYRGILLFALVKAFGDGPRILYTNFGWGALISALLFAIIHSLFWAGEFVFSLENFLFAGFFGFILTWLRLNTGSIVTPILLHSVINTMWRII